MNIYESMNLVANTLFEQTSQTVSNVNPQAVVGQQGASSRGAGMRGAPTGPATQSPVSPLPTAMMPVKTSEGLSTAEQTGAVDNIYNRLIATANFVDGVARSNPRGGIKALKDLYISLSPKWDVNEIAKKADNDVKKLMLVYTLGQYAALYVKLGESKALDGLKKFTALILKSINFDQVKDSTIALNTNKEYNLSKAKEIISYINSSKVSAKKSTQENQVEKIQPSLYEKLFSFETMKKEYLSYYNEYQNVLQKQVTTRGGYELIQRANFIDWFKGVYMPKVSNQFLKTINAITIDKSEEFGKTNTSKEEDVIKKEIWPLIFAGHSSISIQRTLFRKFGSEYNPMQFSDKMIDSPTDINQQKYNELLGYIQSILATFPTDDVRKRVAENLAQTLKNANQTMNAPVSQQTQVRQPTQQAIKTVQPNIDLKK